MPKLSQADKAQVSQSVKHTRLVAASRKLARIVKTIHPTTAQMKRRTRLEKNLGRWLKHYMPETFFDAWGKEHRACLKRFDRCIRDGGSFALAMPRGSGKSAIGKGACTYAALSGQRSYIVPIGATDSLANDYLEFVKSQLDGGNPIIKEDYPDAIGFFKALDGKAIKARDQLTEQGNLTGIEWRVKGIAFPSVLKPDGKTYYPYSGTRIECRGITSAMKGMAKTLAGGRIIRPDFVLPDDVQTEEDAYSETACNKIERKLVGTVLALAGPRRRIACFMPCTCVQPDDVSDRFLSREKHPEFQGQRNPMLLKWPEAQDTLWQEYAHLRSNADDDTSGKQVATAFYLAHRRAMDKGAVVSWKERIRTGEVSAVETAENLLIEMGPEGFAAEMQQAPMKPGVTVYTLTSDIIKSRVEKGRQPGTVPEWAQIIIATTDVNRSYALTTTVLAFGQDQRSAVLWYGIHKMHVEDKWTDSQKKAAIYKALASHGRELAALPCRPQTWIIDGGGSPRDTVIDLSANAPTICGLTAYCAFGRSGRSWDYRGRGKHKSKMFEECQLVRERVGRQWVLWQQHYWMEQAQLAWTGDYGAPGSCSLPEGHHQEFGNQICREILRGKNEIGGRMVWVWDHAVGPHDYADCMAMAYMGAAMEGIGTGGLVVARQTRKTYTQKDLRR